MPPRLSIVCIAALACVPALVAQEPALVVDGKPLVSSVPVQKRGSEIYIPLGPLARALNAEVSIPDESTVRVRRADGSTYVYNGRTGEIRFGAVFTGQIGEFRQIRLYTDPDQILFPASGIVALFGVSAQMDAQERVLSFDSSTAGHAPPPGGAFMLTGLEYSYALSANGAVSGHSGSLRGEAAAGGARLTGLVQVSRTPYGPAARLNNASLRADLGAFRSVMFGDQAVYAGIEPLGNSVRGIGYEQRIGPYRTHAYAGLAIGSTVASFGSSIPRYDTRIAGLSVTRAGRNRAISAGLNAFRSSQRRGATAGFAFTQRNTRNQLNAQFAGGYFSGLSLHVLTPADLKSSTLALSPATGAQFEPGSGSLLETRFIPVKGPAYGASISDALLISSRLAVSGQADYYSKNFLTAREDTRFNGASNNALAVSIRPLQNLTVSLSAGSRSFVLGDPQRMRTYSTAANLTLPVGSSPQLGFTRTLQISDNPAAGRFDMRQYSAILPRFGRYSASLYYTQSRMGSATASDVNAIGSSDFYRYGRVEFHYQEQMSSARRAGADWYLRTGENAGYIRVGLEALQFHKGRTAMLPLGGLRLPLPKGQVLEVSYMRDSSTQIFQLHLGGRLVRPIENLRDGRMLSAMAARTFVSGQVYMDANYSGRPDGSEKGIAGVEVSLDGRITTVTDGRGFYRFTNVDPGAHAIRSQLANVPAGFVFSGSGTQTIAAVPGRDNRLDFAVIKTGQIEGKVTYMDYSAGEDAAVESPLPDARIIATGNLDTFTEANGSFLLGDLAPGLYELRVDPESMPAGYAAQPSSYIVRVVPGSTSLEPRFRLAIPPKPVIEIRAPEQTVQAPRERAAPRGEQPAAQTTGQQGTRPGAEPPN